MRGLFYLVLGLFLSVDATAAPAQRTAPARGRGDSAATTQTTVGRAARAPVARSAAPTSASSSSGTKVVSRGRSATNVTAPVAQSTTVQRGRAAAKQNVIGGGTKITTAAQNTLVDEDCRQKFDGCMDAFCMLDNTNGGRCLCSDRSAELDVVLAEIQKLDEESYKLATVGVEKIEMGESGDAIMAQANAVAESLTAKKEEDKKAKRKALDLSNWSSLGADFDEEVEGLFSPASDPNSIENKTGDALLSAASKLCSAQMSQCSSQIKMLDLMYKQRVRSDCTAYENSLRQSRTQSAQKLAAAQTAMREAALEQYQNANKYDLGECTVEFKKCMQTTGGCGDDFTGCVGLAADVEAATENKITKKKAKQYTIKGTVAQITIAASTYDTVKAKQTLCMGVTKQCTSVRDKVWDSFLREVAPALKSAELIAESNLRTSCISNISNCFQKACKDTMDPNNPDGSYDMCLTRPETLESVCKVEVARCKSAEPKIMEYVRARLASMRVDSCTKEFKECLTSEDRCGSDYTQCVGLDTDTIVRLCPHEKLVGCQYADGDSKKTSKEDVEAELYNVAVGIFLGIDNKMLDVCKNAAYQRFIEICGEEGGCESIEQNTNLGTGSLRSSKDQGNGRYETGQSSTAGQITIDGKVQWGAVELVSDKMKNLFPGQKDDSAVSYYTIKQKYRTSGTNADESRIEKLVLAELKQEVDRRFKLLATDPTVAMCVTGRDISQIDRTKDQKGSKRNRTSARFPNLLETYSSIIADAAIRAAQNNYNRKYTEMLADAVSESEDYRYQIQCSRMALTGDENVDRLQIASQDPNEKGKVKTIYEASNKGTFLPENIADGSVIKDDDWETVINGANTDQLKEALAMQNYSERAIVERISTALKEVKKRVDRRGVTEDEPMFLGKQAVRAVYESGPKACRITTTTTMCSGLGQVSDSKSVNVDTSFQYAGIGGSVGVGVSMTTYKGSVCTAFDEPIISEQIINMKNNQVIQGNITRSNVTTKIVDNSVQNVDNSKKVDVLSGNSSSLSNWGDVGDIASHNSGNNAQVGAGQANAQGNTAKGTIEKPTTRDATSVSGGSNTDLPPPPSRTPANAGHNTKDGAKGAA